MINIKTALAVSVSIILSGCNASNSNNTDGLAAVAGVWDASWESETSANEQYATNEQYSVITSDGLYYRYNYKGDEYTSLKGEAENCYALEVEGKITHLQDDDFNVELDYLTPLTIENTDMSWNISENNEYVIQVIDGKLKMYSPEKMLVPGFGEDNRLIILTQEEVEEAIKKVKLLPSASSSITLENMQSMLCE